MSGRKFSARAAFSVGVLAAIVAAAIVYYRRHADRFHLITDVSVEAVLLLVGLSVLSALLFGLQLKVVTDFFGLGLSFSRWFGLSRMTGLTNMLVPFAGGVSVKAAYLKNYYRLGLSSFAAASLVQNLITLATAALFGVLLLLLSPTDRPAPRLILLGIAGAIGGGSVAFLAIGHRLFGGWLASWPRAAVLLAQWRAMRRDGRTVLKLVVLNVLIYATSTAAIWVSFDAFHISVSLLACGVMAAFTGISSVLRLAPANLGVREAIILAITALYGNSVNEGLHASALGRMVSTAAIVVLAAGFAYPMMRRVTRSGPPSGAAGDEAG